MLFPTMRRLVAACLFVLPLPVTGQVSGNDVVAVEAAMKRDFLNAYLRVGPEDDAIRTLVTWQRLRFGDAVFDDYIAFEATHGDWPGQDTLRRAGEGVIPAGFDPQAVIDWFGKTAPLTGQGAVRLAQAFIANGEPARARDAVRRAWIDLPLTDGEQAALANGFGPDLADLHAARADALLWRWQTPEAERMLPLLSADEAALVKARIAYIRNAGNPDAAVAAVPAALRDTPGLLYDRFNWLADKGRQTDAIAILSAQSTSAAALGVPWRWASWRRILSRWQMRDGNYQAAYDLAANHYLTAADNAASYADLEWLAGYLQLRFLNDPARALVHFDNAAAEVDSPISLGRTGYWQGRALEALGRTDDARAAYARGAEHQTSFYGLLAAEKLGVPLDPFLTGRSDPRDWQTADVMQDDLVRAGMALLAAGERGKAVFFFAELGKRLDADDLSRLGAALEAQGETYFEVLLGKSAAARGLIVPSIYFPMHDLAQMDLPVPAALAMSIARRESEFNETVGSPVGALGLMQLMPGTAGDVARSLDLPYEKNRLTADWAYNATLGSRYLADLTERFGDSPVQIAAGYNAGPGRPRDWMAARGDPRAGEVDVIDWIEMIPFRETRNYVQRVTESIPIYEARLTGETGPVRFLDLLTGAGSVVRPVARADGTLEVPAPVTGAGSTQDPGATTDLPRPVARPVTDASTAATTTADGSEPASGLFMSTLTTANVPAPRPVARPTRGDTATTSGASAVTAAMAPAETAPAEMAAPQVEVSASQAIDAGAGPDLTLRPVLRPRR
ncbi:transglycosylase SLT domain-containing protein [Loktanella sp. DJP18]|uniref:lytic transglycosylase domain-containing protein n=1 Tax=Loktanella sp. DJP18 TaxID=3409788 RepID=UPI003BB6BE73